MKKIFLIMILGLTFGNSDKTISITKDSTVEIYSALF